MQLIFEKSKPGRLGTTLPELDTPKQDNLIPEEFLRKDNNLPELSEVDIVRHFTNLSKKNFGVDNGFYPLGSCTMKYNPKVNEDTAKLQNFTNIHPYNPNNQGSLQLMFELERMLSEITGMAQFTLQPAAGAHGELTGLMIIKKYFEDKEEKRTKIIVPDSSHGTNPATASMANYETITIKSNEKGMVNLEELKEHMTKDVAALMLTNPNTLGLFEENILEITKIVHDKGGLVYCDGANMNAILGITKPGDMGIDVIHLNLHKSFSTPHGCGGPGSGPVGVSEQLAKFLPTPIIEKDNNNYTLNYKKGSSIGRIKAFYGNFNVMIKAYTYIRAIGASGLKEVAQIAVLNANYMKEKLKPHFHLPYDILCKHEFVLSDKDMPNHVTTGDIAKRLLDYNFHPPTVYFPLIVPGAIMIEPTETEPKEMLDKFIETLIKIKEEAKNSPDLVKNAPQTTPVTRLDAVAAARNPELRYNCNI
ncbi:MAG: aminomethyl-transferring glycine dehydrogenase subunit GcvPB [Candidatus Woesearchaeota archaeon]|jgi:glycine dehydrogenase subunit 2|nr:aminomethyl-transferring glycine dehydrogenase subunit GcvPB [Candidatus Woesearchaeota archaeon]